MSEHLTPFLAALLQRIESQKQLQPVFRFGDETQQGNQQLAQEPKKSVRPPPQVIFIAPPNFEKRDELYEARDAARTNLQEYMRKIARTANNGHERLAIIDWMDVLTKASHYEFERVESPSSGKGGIVAERKEALETATRKQIARGRRERDMRVQGEKRKPKYPYNTTIIELAELGNRLVRAEVNVIRFPFSGVNRAMADRTRNPAIPRDDVMQAEALGTVANHVNKFYRETFHTRRRSA